MLHVPALPGTPANEMTISQIVDHVRREAQHLSSAGVQALMLENMHDRPYLKREVGAEITATLTSCALAVRQQSDLPVGIQILAGANMAALAVASAADLQFIRAEGFVFGHLADEGLMQSDAGELLRFRRQIGAEQIQVFTDIKKKHSSHALTADVSLSETLKATEFFLSDGVVITGTATGETIDLRELKEIYSNSGIPVITGSGIDADNLAVYWAVADAFIVGSSLKVGGLWSNPLDPDRIAQLVKTRSQLLDDG